MLYVICIDIYEDEENVDRRDDDPPEEKRPKWGKRRGWVSVDSDLLGGFTLNDKQSKFC